MKTINTLKALSHQLLINEIIDYIEENIETDLDLNRLASLSKLSKYHFLRIFKQHMGEPPLQYITRLKLEKVASLILTRPDDYIYILAHEIGFTDLAYFSKKFKQQFGLSPKKWKENNKKIYFQNSNNVQVNNKSLAYYCKQVDNFIPQNNTIKNETIKMTRLQSFDVVYYRHVGSYISTEKVDDKMWKKLYDWADPKGLLKQKDTKTIAIYHDDANLTEVENQRKSFCLSIPKNISIDASISRMTITGGKYFVASFKLRLNEIILAWDWVMKYLSVNTYKVDNRYCFELYPKEPQKGFYNIEIYIPLKN